MSLLGSKLKRLTAGPPGLLRVLNDIIDRLNEVRGFTGDGRYIAASNVGGTWAFRWIGPRLTADTPRLFRVTGYTPIEATEDDNGNPTQWTYTVEEITKATAGYGGWAALSGGYTGAAYSMDEDANTGTGRQMNGVDHDGANYPAGFEMYPMQIGLIRPGIFVPVASTGALELWLLSPNGEDGTCS